MVGILRYFKSNSHQFRKKKMKPITKNSEILPHVIFSFFTPIVPRHDKARNRTANSFVHRMDENKPVVR